MGLGISVIRSEGDIYLIRVIDNSKLSLGKVYDGNQFGRAEDYCYHEADSGNLSLIVSSPNGVYFSETIMNEKIVFHRMSAVEGKKIVGLRLHESTAFIYYLDRDIIWMTINGSKCQCEKLAYEESEGYSGMSSGFAIFGSDPSTIETIEDNKIRPLSLSSERSMRWKIFDITKFNEKSGDVEIISDNITNIRYLKSFANYLIVDGNKITETSILPINGVLYIADVYQRQGKIKTVAKVEDYILFIESNSLIIINSKSKVESKVIGVSDLSLLNNNFVILTTIHGRIILLEIKNDSIMLRDSEIDLPDLHFPEVHRVNMSKNAKSARKR